MAATSSGLNPDKNSEKFICWGRIHAVSLPVWVWPGICKEEDQLNQNQFHYRAKNILLSTFWERCSEIARMVTIVTGITIVTCSGHWGPGKGCPGWPGWWPPSALSLSPPQDSKQTSWWSQWQGRWLRWCQYYIWTCIVFNFKSWPLKCKKTKKICL